jgi:hypothetical protein
MRIASCILRMKIGCAVIAKELRIKAKNIRAKISPVDEAVQNPAGR